MRNINLLILISLFIFFSCQSEKNTETVNEDFPETIEVPINPTPGDNSMNALDWEGTYVGTLPCADCEGIETELTINYDGTYSYKTTYLGKETEAEEVTGTFQWDENGSVITLAGARWGSPESTK